MLIRERGLASRMVPIEVIKITTIINNIIMLIRVSAGEGF